MARLVAFGCSYTYGYGLEDCYLNTDSPSKLAWPDLLANELSIEHLNNGVIAASNKKILLEILDTTFEKDDIVIVVWSYTHRGLLLESADSSLNIVPNFSHPLKKPYYEVHTHYDLLVKSVLDIHHANTFLNNKGVKVYNYYIDQSLHKLDDCQYLSLLKDINLIWLDMRKFRLDLANDGMHPGPLSHKGMSKFIRNSLLSNSSIV